MKLRLQRIAGMAAVIMLFMAMACSEDDSGTNGDTDSYDNKLTAEISGDYSGTFTPTTITTNELFNMAVLMGANSKEVLTLQFDKAIDVGSHEKIIGSFSLISGSVAYIFTEGALTIETNNDDIIKGTFSCTATTVDGSKSVSISVGSFTYVKKKD